MNIVRFGKVIHDAIADYEHRLDYDTTACLIDRLNAVEKEVAALRLTVAELGARAAITSAHSVGTDFGSASTTALAL